MRLVPDLFGHSLYKGQQIFCHNVDFLGIKRHRILCRIQKYKLSLVKIVPTKSYKRKKDAKNDFLRLVLGENT
jgi:hypothetical protein